ncbi:major facilitator superfamily domain-containing protein [Apiosordaria backusii]|uniref:Major facilitator superfamily domain-containing protein n=1 Tax=Apiosordaria backusii TaxID=314023 RepID=A0AA40DYZ4_9PEZI|nr:major facilitator superfamily domain-containing protein [Apiosordaria backusii]
MTNNTEQLEFEEEKSSTSLSKKPAIRQVLLTLIICLGLMFSCLDTSIVSTALVKIAHEFQNTQDIPWTILSYLLTYMSFAVGFSKLSDIYGRKAVLLSAWVLFTIGSVWCGWASSMPQLIAGRAVQGVGGSGLYSLAQVCLVEQGPARPEVVGGLVGVTLSVSFVLGPVMGGGLLTWGSLPFGVVSIAGILFLWPRESTSLSRKEEYQQHSTLQMGSFWHKLGKIDFIGNTLLALASILLVFALQEAGSFVWKWDSPVIIWSLAFSLVCFVFLGVWERYLYRGQQTGKVRIEGIFPVGLVKGRVYACVLVNTLLSGFVYIALVIKIPERLQIVYFDSALWAGVHLLPMLGSCAFGSFLGGLVSKKKDLTSHTLIVGSVLQVLGLGLMVGFDSHYQNYLSMGQLLAFTAVYGLGVGLSFASATIIAAIEAKNDDLAAAQGAVAQARVFGGALGLAVCGILLNERLESGLRGRLGGLESLHRSLYAILGLKAEDRQLVVGVYVGAFGEQLMGFLGVAVVGAVVALGTWRGGGKGGRGEDGGGGYGGASGEEVGGRMGRVERGREVELESGSSVRSLMR